MQSTEVKLAEAQHRLNALERELEICRSGKERSIADLTTALEELRDNLRQSEVRLAESNTVYAEDMYRAEILRSRTAYGAREYRGVLDKTLSRYRSERAWMVMLTIRKAYTMLFLRGARGKFDLLKWLIALPFSGAKGLEDYDLRFPDLSLYQPEELDRPLVLRNNSAAPDAIISPAPCSSLPAGIRAQTKYDVIVLAIIDFDFRFQRPQQIAAQFAREGHRVFWVSPSRFLPPGSKPYEIVELRENLWEVHLCGRPVDIYTAALDSDLSDALSRSLTALYRDLAVGESCVVVQLPCWRAIAGHLQKSLGSKLLYDCMDDWETFENIGSFNRAEEAELVRQCDLLVVTGQELVRKFKQRQLNPLLVRNGADFEFFRAVTPNNLLADIRGPIVGYFGAIADWIDLDLIEEVARLRPNYSFVLIGQIFGRDVSKLKALPNVFLLGNKSYADIPAYLLHFDVCIIPFLLNQVTKATDPVKLYEYFSLGKPVVATDMQELSQCSELLYIGKGPLDFAAKLDLALDETDDGLKSRRIAFASENTWASRVATMDNAISSLFPLVSILIVTHDSSEFVNPCLDSIRRNTSYPNYEVLIVDNASADSTRSLVRHFAALDQRLHLTCVESNRGFAAANNIAAAQARGEYLLLLNADTMVTSGWIERLMRPFLRDKTMGLVCPVTNFAGNEIKINVTYRDSREMEIFALALAREKVGQELQVNMAPLFCALIPRAVWEKIGGLDERFGLGMFEDDDFCHRVAQVGFRIAAAEDCFIHHFGQGSFRKLLTKEYNQIFERNRQLFEEKWEIEWQPHKTRPGVRAAFEDHVYTPAAFLSDYASRRIGSKGTG